MTPHDTETLCGRGTLKTVPAVLFFLLISASSLASQTLNRSPGWPGTTLNGVACFGEGQGYGPYDYNLEKQAIEKVETFHFYPEIEQLQLHAARLDGDLDYTLRAVPNHHRALWARVRFFLRTLDESDPTIASETEKTRKGHPPPECYFQRAQAFNPGDGVVPGIFGIYLHKRGKLEAALAEYKKAEKMIPKHPELIYNMGLLFLDLNQIDEAKKYAERARSLGYPLSGLSRRIGQREAQARQNNGNSDTGRTQ